MTDDVFSLFSSRYCTRQHSDVDEQRRLGLGDEILILPFSGFLHVGGGIYLDGTLGFDIY